MTRTVLAWAVVILPVLIGAACIVALILRSIPHQ